MKKLSVLLTSLLAVFLITNLSSCSNDQIVNIDDEQTTITANSGTRSAGVQFTKKNIEEFNILKARLEAGEDISSELASLCLEKFSKIESQGADIVMNRIMAIINPDDYVCDDETDLTKYIDSTLSDWGLLEILFYIYFGDLPVYQAIYFTDPVAERQVFGLNGEFTNQINRTFKSLQRFWAIDYRNILLVSMNGDVYKDYEKLYTLLDALYLGVDDETVTMIQEIFTSEAFWGGDHPLLTFNAFSLQTNSTFIKNRVVIGDGLLLGYAKIGLDDVAPQAALAHEYAHQVQFSEGYFDMDAPADEAEATRRTELMCDAYTGYFLTHKRGSALNWDRVNQYFDVAYNIGDCGFTSSGHHGTPLQREAAAKWGYILANIAHQQGHILPLDVLYNYFQESLDEIVNCPNCVTNQ